VKKSFSALFLAMILIVTLFTGIQVSAAPVAEAEFYNSFGDRIEMLTDETEISARISFTPNKSSNANVVAAMYEGGKMSGFDVVATQSVAAGKAVTIPVEEFSIGNAEEVKLLVWNGFNSASPLVSVPCTISRKVYKPFAEVETKDGKVAKAVTLTTAGVTAKIPEGVVVADGVKTLGLIVTPILNSNSGITAGENEKLESLDIHIEGIAKNNTTPIIVTVEDATAIGLNSGNLALYHVENGETVKMTQVNSAEELTAHNSFYYDVVTGSVTLALCSFSEIAMLSDVENAWNGAVDTDWYNTTDKEFKIASADQLAGFGQIVGGMADGIEQDSFEGKTITLIADINIGDSEEENNPEIIFYPIGYNSSDGSYEKTGVAVTTGFYPFEGTFDGNGHTISNIYQNTWEMKGDNEFYEAELQYYRDGMGLFGQLMGATIKNLTVDNFKSDGEYTTTGVIATYADSANGKSVVFENIAITNCNPRVYNIGNGGIVGIGGWYAQYEEDVKDKPIIFRNITVDNTNKISALWGSYDVACSGIMGRYYPASECGVEFDNCHVAAQIDVYNDVCGNYQYYWYRYAGMMIGTVTESETDENGYTIPKLDGITAKDCTVHFGDWNNYWYCELVVNSIASYTHDHQFSRLTRVDSVDVENKTITVDGVTTPIPETGRCNYVVVTKPYSTENAECFHFVDGEVWNHADAGYEDFDLNGDGELNDLKEDNYHIYLPFDQLFQGSGWGVKHIPTGQFDGVTVLDRETADSVKKFDSNVLSPYEITTGTTLSVGELFKEADGNQVEIKKAHVLVTVSPVDETNTALSATYTANTTDWTQGTLTFSGKGEATVTITDYYFCTPTTITVNVIEEVAQPVDKFTGKNTTITRESEGEPITVTIGDIFDVIDESLVVASDVTVTVTGEGAVLSENAENWKLSTLTFDGEGTATVTINDNNLCNDATATVSVVNPAAVDKFTANNLSQKLAIGESSVTKTLGEIFTAKDSVTINSSKVTVSGAEVVTKNDADWTQTTVKFTDVGTHSVTISDNNFCIPATATVTLVAPDPVQKFAKKFNNESFTYRVGNVGEVTLGTLFEQADANVPFGNISVTVETMNGTAATGTPGSATYTSANWTSGNIKFNNVGIVKVTVTDDMYCIPTELILEVVDATNTTGAASATENNVVLLKDAGFSTIEVSGGYTLFGNGFTLTRASDSAVLDMGYSFVTLNNGTLDNVQIICPNFDYAVLYKTNLTDSGNRSETTDKTRYYNAMSGVMAYGNSRILNSRISGGRASVNISGGDVLIENSSIERGAAASILVGAANSVTLKDITLIQKPTVSTSNANKTLMGFSVLSMADASGNTAPITLEGTLVQFAWANKEYKSYVPSDGQSMVDSVLSADEYLHSITYPNLNNATYDSVNLGFAYMPYVDGINIKLNTPTINDNRTDKAIIPYELTSISQAKIYTYANSNGTADSFKTEPVFTPNRYSDIINVSYADAKDGLTDGKSLGSDGWVYELNVDLDKLPGYALDFSKLSMTVNGVVINDYKVNGSTKPTSSVAVVAGGVTYTLTATVDGKEYTTYYKVTGTETSKESPSLVATNYEAGICVASSKGGTWSGAAPALVGIQIKYWSVAEKQYKTINLADYTPTTKGKLNGSNTTWTYTPDNGDFTLTLTGGQVHSSNKVNAIPVCVEDNGAYKLYYVAATSSGLVNSGNGARSIPVTYTFKDNNNGTPLTFSHSWSVSEDKNNPYNYSSLVDNGTLSTEFSSGSGCVTPDTLITLADGSQKAVEDLTLDDMLLVWNLETGAYDVAPIVFVDSEEESEYEVVNLYFDNGDEVGVIYEHGFFDLDLGKYVYIDATNANDYIGHTFVTQDSIENNTWSTAKLEKVVIENKVTTAWSPVTFEHLCYYTNGVLSMPGGIEGLFNIFDVDTTVMAYDKAKMQQDIETYGLFTLEDFEGVVSEIGYLAFNGDILKVAMGKGMLTWEDIEYLAARYMPLVSEN